MVLTVDYTQPEMSVWRKRIGSALREMRKHQGLSQGTVAELAGMHIQTVGRVENGTENVEFQSIEQVARALNVDVSHIVRDSVVKGDLGSIEYPEDIVDDDIALIRAYKAAPPADQDQVRRVLLEGSNVEIGEQDVSNYVKNDIPVIGHVEADPDGTLEWPEEGIEPDRVERRVSRPDPLIGKPAYAFIVKGDSMAPMFPSGTELIIAPTIRCEEGKPAIFVFKDGRRLLKIFHKTTGGYLLESINNSYPPRVVSAQEIEAVLRVRYARY